MEEKKEHHHYYHLPNPTHTNWVKKRKPNEPEVEVLVSKLVVLSACLIFPSKSHLHPIHILFISSVPVRSQWLLSNPGKWVGAQLKREGQGEPGCLLRWNPSFPLALPTLWWPGPGGVGVFGERGIVFELTKKQNSGTSKYLILGKWNNFNNSFLFFFLLCQRYSFRQFQNKLFSHS